MTQRPIIQRLINQSKRFRKIHQNPFLNPCKFIECKKHSNNRLAFSLKNAINFKACLSLSDKPIQSHYSVKYP
ncbi:hypothetical protein EWZ95_01415 [Helicobacter pylori]|nr:hypothetical protein [Helicobacter pylori]NHA90534.1 hypothetical protein [Helicobacter pylori]QEF23638.1 hypothetical protein D2C85_01985 [Helicobacter pylori]